MTRKININVLTFLLMFILLNCQSKKSFIDTYGAIEPIRSRENTVLDGWQNYYFSTEDCSCISGGEFFVALKENASPTDNLMITLQGGGACWPGKLQCKPNAIDGDVLDANFTSELDERLAEDWNQVVIPYCDGSVYMGDTKLDYNGNGEIDYLHNGLKNSVAGLKLVQKNFPDASKIFLTGCSAGGYGTIIQLRLIRTLYPKAKIYVLNESGPGLMKPDSDFWNLIDSSWNLKQLVPQGCTQCEGQLIYWYEEMLDDPGIKIGLFSSYMDHVIGLDFLNMEPENYKSLLLETTKDLRAKYPDQFKRFFINGKSHCIDDRNYDVNDFKYWDWVLAFINDTEEWKDILE